MMALQRRPYEYHYQRMQSSFDDFGEDEGEEEEDSDNDVVVEGYAGTGVGGIKYRLRRRIGGRFTMASDLLMVASDCVTSTG